MEFNSEDLGRVAILQVCAIDVVFKGIAPQRIGNVDIAVVGKAKIVACHNALSVSDEQLDAVRNAWVLVVEGNVSEELVAVAHPYVTIVKSGADAASYEQFSRGWNVETVTGEHSRKNVITVGTSEMVEVLFGESRENPIGLLSIKCLKQ